MHNRRSILKAALTVGLASSYTVAAQLAAQQHATPSSLQDAPWLAGNSAKHNMPETAMAEPGTVQALGASPVLFDEFAVFLIHNATNTAVMIRSVSGTLSVPDLPEVNRDISAYNVPPVILPPDEYWIGSLKLPKAIAVGTEIEFDATVVLHSEMPNTEIATLLTTIPPEGEFELPEEGETWPITYQNEAPFTPGRIAKYQQVFFDDDGHICGAIKSDDEFNDEGGAEFLMRHTSAPTMNSGGLVLGEMSDRWLAQWSHMVPNDRFQHFDFGV